MDDDEEDQVEAEESEEEEHVDDAQSNLRQNTVAYD